MPQKKKTHTNSSRTRMLLYALAAAVVSYVAVSVAIERGSILSYGVFFISAYWSARFVLQAIRHAS